MIRSPVPSPSTSRAPLRVALYGHDSFGLGHLRRNLLLAQLLVARLPGIEILLVSGSPRADSFPLPPGVRIEKLPSVTKDSAGRYVSMRLDVPIGETVRLRKRYLRAAILDFRPDVLVVDHTPLGLRGELLPLLADLRHSGAVQLVLGLRDIMDDAQRVRRDWRRAGVYPVLEQLYHHVWVYGAAEVFPIHRLYGLPPGLESRIRYLGYLGRNGHGRRRQDDSLSASFPDRARPHVLCMLGGGGDGEPLGRAFVDALAARPDRWNGTLLTGPFLSRECAKDLDARAETLPHLQVLRFTDDVEMLIAGSDAVISMGGYNSVVELLSLGRRALVVPRNRPRREQWLRAHALARRGLLRVLDPDFLERRALEREIEHLLAGPQPPEPRRIGLEWDGARNFTEQIVALCDASRPDGGNGSRDHARARPV